VVLWATQTHNSVAHLISGSFAWPQIRPKVGNIYPHGMGGMETGNYIEGGGAWALEG